MEDLESLLVDPDTHERVRRATPAELAKVNAAIDRGRARRRGGGELPSTVEGGYVSNGRWIYADVAGIPSFLVDDRLELDDPL